MNKVHKTSTIIIVHSVAYYLLSYLVILLFFQTVTVISAQFFEIPAIIHYNRMDFLIVSQAWSFDSIKLIFASGCIVALLIGLICLVIFIKAIALEGVLKIFFFWGFVHGLNMFVGSLVLGAFLYEGMGYVYAWMYLQDTEKMFLLFSGLVVLLGTGTLMIRPMLLTANSYYSSSRAEMRMAFKREQFFYPYLISTVILILLRLPLSLYELLLIITPGIILLPLFSNLHRFTIFFFDENQRSIKLNKKIIIIAASLIIVFRVLLGFGIRIG
jgi:hypothetical protein